MKSKSSYLFLLPFCLLSITNAHSQALNAKTLSFGTGNIFSGYGGATNGAAIGANNQLLRNYNLAIGNSNKFYGSYNLAVGGFNTFGANTEATGSAVIGFGSRISASGSLAIGSYNTMDDDYEFGSGNDSLLAGKWNESFGYASFCIGSNNSVSYFSTVDSIGFPGNTMLLGKGLISRTDDCVVVGKNNIAASERQTGASAPVFVVGTGQSATARADALVVRANGDIIITKAQGDISMGIYQ